MGACVFVLGMILAVLEYAEEKVKNQLTLGNGFGKAGWGKEISLSLYTSVLLE